MTVPFMVMLRSKATKHLKDSSGLLSLRMTERKTVMPPNEMRIRHLPYYYEKVEDPLALPHGKAG